MFSSRTLCVISPLLQQAGLSGGLLKTYWGPGHGAMWVLQFGLKVLTCILETKKQPWLKQVDVQCFAT